MSWRSRRLEVRLDSSDFADPSGPVRLGCIRFPEDGDLTVELPTGWTVDAWMGYDPDAAELVTDWMPVNPEAGQLIFERALAGLQRAVGVSEDELRRALSGLVVA